jgi:hypothetical protein
MGFYKHSDEVLDFIVTWNVHEDFHFDFCLEDGGNTFLNGVVN